MQRTAAAGATVDAVLKGRAARVKLASGRFLEAFRSVLYTTGGQRQVPQLIHDMYRGNYQAFIDLASRGEGMFAEGLYLSIVCAEDTGWITDEDRGKAGAGSFLGSYRVDRQREACKVWNVPKVSPADAAPAAAHRAAGFPVLLIAGERDSVTPVAGAQRDQSPMAKRWARLGDVAASSKEAGTVEAVHAYPARPLLETRQLSYTGEASESSSNDCDFCSHDWPREIGYLGVTRERGRHSAYFSAYPTW